MSIEPRTYRDIWGNFATGVTVITTEVDGWLHGMTANGVTSVSLDPLLMLVCVDKGARCHAQLSAAGKFGVSFLTQEQEDVSNLFAKGVDPEQGALRGAAFHFGANGTAILDDCLAHLECRLVETLAGGDHDIFVGEAIGGEISRPEAPPLLFFRGGYRQLA
jgi:flavin reductase (DIM6/NTAB) family NADH-FMN oxidoreductase RutF